MAQTPSSPPRLVLASRSPRRRELLSRAGVEHAAADPGVDDGPLRPGRVSPAQWVAALAYLKARAGCEQLEGPIRGPIKVMGADTVCVHRGRVIGQPRDRAHAERTIRSFLRTTHEVVSGVAIVDTATGARALLADTAAVTWGHVPDDEIEAYLDSGTWRGKAGAYNLAERVQAGWPITVDGDPDTVVGLPMRRLGALLENFDESLRTAGAA